MDRVLEMLKFIVAGIVAALIYFLLERVRGIRTVRPLVLFVAVVLFSLAYVAWPEKGLGSSAEATPTQDNSTQLILVTPSATPLFSESNIGTALIYPFMCESQNPLGILFYGNGFENGAGPEWSDRKTELTPSGQTFLGQFGTKDESLFLADIPPHSIIIVEFDLYIIKSWDGNKDQDYWKVQADETELLMTTFDNLNSSNDDNHRQDFPSSFTGNPRGLYPPRETAVENNTLGYDFKGELMDATYHLCFQVPHESEHVSIIFSGLNLENNESLEDETWGLDNVRIKLVD